MRAREVALWGHAAVDEHGLSAASKPNYLLRAIAGGVVGAAIGALCYAAFVGLTGWTLGYVAVLVGWLVGKGMMMASEDRGGPRYQVAAVALTYLSVAAAKAALLWLSASQSHPVSLDLGSLLGLAKVGLMFPVLSVMLSPMYGLIGLLILFVGMRAAYRMTSANPGERRSPFKH